MSSLLLKRKAYTVSFNKMTNQPDWVAWCLTDDELSGKVSRSKDFYEDPDLPLMPGLMQAFVSFPTNTVSLSF